jgi:hypothetical protein
VGTTFVDVFKYAYSVRPHHVVGGPGWLRTQKFEIAGHFDLVLRWTPDSPGGDGKPADSQTDRPNLFTAIKEQLELKSQPMKANTD